MIKRHENETDFEYGLRLIEYKMDNNSQELDWQDIIDTLDLGIHRDTLRKASQTDFGGYNVYKYMKDKLENNTVTSDDILDKIQEEKRQLKLERYKLQTEKIEDNKWHREVARIDLFEEKMMNVAKLMQPIQVPNITFENRSVNKVGVLGIADTHFGKLVDIKGLLDETLNKYDEEIFQDRMWYILKEIKHITIKEELDKIDLYLLGDLIDGMLRQSQLRSLQYGITDSVIKFTEFMALWLNELSKLCYVEVFTSTGNHSEIRILGSKAGEFPHENAERLIAWYLKARLQDNQNITIHDAKFINFKNTLGVNVFATHGQNDKNLEQSIKDYSTIYRTDIDLLLTGHLHSGLSKSTGIGNYGNVEVIQFPSICGIDDFSMKLKRSACAGTKMLIIEEGKGKTIAYDINIQM